MSELGELVIWALPCDNNEETGHLNATCGGIALLRADSQLSPDHLIPSLVQLLL